MPVMVWEDSQQHQREADPAKRHVAVARRRRNGRDHREKRLVLNAIDDGRVVVVDGHRGIAVPHVQMLVHGVEHGAAGILRLDEDARDDLELAVHGEVGGHHVPGGAQVYILLADADVGERARIEVAVARELETVGVGIHVHLVVADGELMGPALHRVGLVAVQDDVLGHVVEIDPVLVDGIQGKAGIALGQFLPLVERTLHAGHLPAKPPFIVGTDARKSQQHDGQHEQHMAVVPDQKPADTKPVWMFLAHS